MDKNRIPNFSGDTNPFMPSLDSHGNYKKVIYKIPVSDLSEEDSIKRLRELKEKFKFSPLNNKNLSEEELKERLRESKDYFIPVRNMKEKTNVNYMHVVPNSHFWTDLNQILASIDYEFKRKKIEDTKDNRIIGGVIYLAEPFTKEYILVGLNNCIKNGYKLKPTFKEDIKVRGGSVPIFESVKQMIEYVQSEKFNLVMFKDIIEQTIKTEINLTNGLKMKRQDVYKRIDGERDYQDQRWNTNLREGDVPDEEKPVAEWLNYIEYHLSKAKNINYHLDKEATLAELRKVAALAVRCLEIHGCPERFV